MSGMTLLRIGAVCAVLGTILSVAAGIGFGNLPDKPDTTAVLGFLAFQPHWYWPAVHTGFILGAIFWLAAFGVISRSLEGDAAYSVSRLGLLFAGAGTVIHVIDSSISGIALAAVARHWSGDFVDKQFFIHQGDMLRDILSGTWAAVLSFFHGLPFILFGITFVISSRYPKWLGWIGIVGGLGSLVCGILMFWGAALPSRLFIVFALIVSLWMFLAGVVMWRVTTRTPRALSPGEHAA
jgi:hypothetical protein